MNKIGALWKKKSKNGNTYFSGVIDAEVAKGTQIVIFQVAEKKSDKSPDYQILLSEPREKQAAEKVEQSFGDPDDDIPFN